MVPVILKGLQHITAVYPLHSPRASGLPMVVRVGHDLINVIYTEYDCLYGDVPAIIPYVY
jgi:hypothetical protein